MFWPWWWWWWIWIWITTSIIDIFITWFQNLIYNIMSIKTEKKKINYKRRNIKISQKIIANNKNSNKVCRYIKNESLRLFHNYNTWYMSSLNFSRLSSCPLVGKCRLSHWFIIENKHKMNVNIIKLNLNDDLIVLWFISKLVVLFCYLYKNFILLCCICIIN